MYKSERDHIEQTYWEARDQVRSRLLAAIDERRRKLTAEKEGGDIVSGEFSALAALWALTTCPNRFTHTSMQHTANMTRSAPRGTDSPASTTHTVPLACRASLGIAYRYAAQPPQRR